MKKILFLFLLFFPVVVSAQDGRYPWVLHLGGGGINLCVEDTGCFGPSGYTIGGAFGRAMSDNWAFELEGFYAKTTETLPPRVDAITGILFFPELDRSRVYAGATFLLSVADFGRSNFFIAIGGITAFERQTERTPPGIFHTPTRDLGLKGGLSGGAGANLWFSDSWGLRPEVRFYAVPDLSGFRYTGGLIKKF